MTPFMYEPSAPPTIPDGLTVQQYRRTRTRTAAPRSPRERLRLRRGLRRRTPRSPDE